MKLQSESHPTVEALERYSLGRLIEGELERVEEHLFVCERCQDALVEIDPFVSEMKIACREQLHRQEPVRVGFFTRLFNIPRPALASACAALALAVVVPVVRHQPSVLAPAMVTWETTSRGTDSPAEAQAGRPLHLEFGVSELSAARAYRVEIVNADGGPVWNGVPNRRGAHLSVEVKGPLGAGLYWVRLYGSDRDPLREFGLRLN